MMWIACYIVSIIAVNWLFVTLPYIHTPLGEWSGANLVVGFVFVLRDLAQRQIGHYILLATLAAGAMTYMTVNPAVALASVTAFMVSETVDWGVYSFTKRPLEQRILLSSSISSPADTIVFLSMMNFLTPASFTLETASKIAGAVLVWVMLRRRVLMQRA